MLLLFTACFLLVSADTHSLQYRYTAVTPRRSGFPEFSVVGLLNGEQLMSYSSSNRLLIPMDWMKIKDEDYWKSETQDMQGNQDTFTSMFTTVMKQFKHSEGVHTLQRMYSCELDDDGTTRGYDEYGYDREDFISLDLETGTWTAANDKAENFIKEWDPNGVEAKYWKNYLKYECVDRLWTFVSSGRETLERKVRPTASLFQKHSSPEVVCHATGFFPKTVMITWQKDGEDVHEDVELRETLPNQDGSFQKRSILTVSAEDLQKHTYTCVIRHSSLEKEIVLEVPKDGGSGGGQIGINAAMATIIAAMVTLIALIALAAVVLKKKKFDFKPIPSNSMSSAEEDSSCDGFPAEPRERRKRRSRRSFKV